MTTDNQGILLESGTNEFEIVEFSVGITTYGINVAKVREVINRVPVTQMPNTPPCVDGVFSLRGKVMPLVDLARVLSAKREKEASKIIVCELNNFHVGFLVDEVSRIQRISWSAMEPPPNVTNSEEVVGIVKIADKMIILFYFEKIVADINPEINRKLSSVPQMSDKTIRTRKTKKILVAEDSKMLRDLLLNTLHASGYENITMAENGAIAWDKLQAIARSSESVTQELQLVITDIEMPQMDGHHLIKRIKDDDNLKALPVIIFSSLINPEMRRKGELLGAVEQVTKPEIEQLIGFVDQYIL